MGGGGGRQARERNTEILPVLQNLWGAVISSVSMWSGLRCQAELGNPRLLARRSVAAGEACTLL